MSESNGRQLVISKVIAALVKAQSEVQAAKKDSRNPHFGSSYSDLASVADAIKPAFTANGLAWKHKTKSDNTGVYVKCVIMHSSGEEKEQDEWLWLPLDKPTAQAVGSALTYGRRYTLQAEAGLVSDDDDGNAATAFAAPKQNKDAVISQKQTLEAKVAEMAKAGTNGAPPPERSTATQVKFGRTKGQYLCDIPEKDLTYHLAAAKKAVEANDEKWHQSNLAWANTVEAEVARRGLVEGAMS